MQPGYLPWLGFFELVYNVDEFVILDSVKYTKSTWRNRNRIRSASKTMFSWLTVPVEAGSENLVIKDVRISQNANWQQKHLNSIKDNYSRAKYFDLYFPLISDTLSKDWNFLIDLDMHTMEKLLSLLGGNSTSFTFSSDLKITESGKTQKLLEICQSRNADFFYDSAGAKSFFDIKVFNDTGITVEFQDYSHPTYNQLYTPFMPGLSTLDLVMNYGNESLKILLGDSYDSTGSK